MRLTPIQLVGIIVALAVAYVVYAYWFVDQDQNSWIRKLNSGVYDSEKELKDTEPEPKNEDDGWI